MPGNRQGMQVQPGRGGRVEAALSVHPHGAPRHRLSQGISQALASQRFWLAVSALHERRFEVTSESPAGGALTQHGVTNVSRTDAKRVSEQTMRSGWSTIVSSIRDGARSRGQQLLCDRCLTSRAQRHARHQMPYALPLISSEGYIHETNFLKYFPRAYSRWFPWHRRGPRTVQCAGCYPADACCDSGRVEVANRKFAKLDTKHRGYVNSEDVSQLQGFNFKNADKNGDGKLDAAEFNAAWTIYSGHA